MCTIVALHRSHARYPLVVAANRDEMYARPTAAADVILDAPLAVGGRDLSKGGTWLGATAGGFLVAVTNQRSYGGRDEAMKSRGTLVLDLLSRGALGAALEHLRSIDAREYRNSRRWRWTSSTPRSRSARWVRPPSRTCSSTRWLLQSSGFRLERVISTHSPFSVIEATRV